ncbi:MAG: PIN domain-containing protein [Ardenticatenia bacterium]|nr:PIN domain-containing protein [Ardenticatenia bacterium]
MSGRHRRHHPTPAWASRPGPQAARILRETDAGNHHVYLSAITLMEILYLSEAKRVDVHLDELIKHVSESRNYEIVPVNADVVLAAAEVDDVPELHDRIIVGTAKWPGVPILTGDEVISKSSHVQAIW